MRSRIGYLIAVAVLGALAYTGVRADHKSFVGSLFAAFLSAFAMFFIETELNPQISVVKEAKKCVVDGRRFLRVIAGSHSQ
jgi:hypothetical protein